MLIKLDMGDGGTHSTPSAGEVESGKSLGLVDQSIYLTSLQANGKTCLKQKDRQYLNYDIWGWALTSIHMHTHEVNMHSHTLTRKAKL